MTIEIPIWLAKLIILLFAACFVLDVLKPWELWENRKMRWAKPPKTHNNAENAPVEINRKNWWNRLFNALKQVLLKL